MAKARPFLRGAPTVLLNGEPIPGVTEVELRQEAHGGTVMSIIQDPYSHSHGVTYDYDTTTTAKFRLADTNPKKAPNTEETEDMGTKQQQEIRHKIGEVIREALEAGIEGLKIKLIEVEEDRNGPMGGVSTQVLVYADTGETGGLNGVAINVYSDDKINDKAKSRMERVRAERELREDVFGEDE